MVVPAGRQVAVDVEILVDVVALVNKVVVDGEARFEVAALAGGKVCVEVEDWI